VETSSGSDPAFYLAAFLSRRYISMPRTAFFLFSRYWTQSPESVRSIVGEIEDKVPCRDTYPFEGNWVRENTRSGVEGTLIWIGKQTPFMVDRDPAFYLAAFLSRRYISMPRTAFFLFSILDPTLSKSPTRGSLRRCPENVTKENTRSGVEGTLIWIGKQTPFMVDRTSSLENEKVYDRDTGDTIPLSDLHQL
jgi:hypothetical protein